MTYTAVLWACVSARTGGGGSPCSGFRYLEVDAEPGRCGQATADYGKKANVICDKPMVRVGEFELEEEVA